MEALFIIGLACGIVALGVYVSRKRTSSSWSSGATTSKGREGTNKVK